jgi:hypothetical protein
MPTDLQDDAHEDSFSHELPGSRKVPGSREKSGAPAERGSSDTESPLTEPLAEPSLSASMFSSDAKDQWKSLRKKVRLRAEKQSAKKVLGRAAKGGNVYRWGIESATRKPIGQLDDVLSRLACNKKVGKKQIQAIDWTAELEAVTNQSSLADFSPVQCSRAVMWAAAMPALIDHLEYQTWWDLLQELTGFRETVMDREGSATLPRLIVAGEMALTLAWRLGDLPSCARLRKAAIDSVARWCEHEEDSIAATIAGAKNARLGLASLIRCQRIIQATTKQKQTKQQKNVRADIATWVAALTANKGSSALLESSLKLAMKDDIVKHGLLDAAAQCDPSSLVPAMNAAIGKTQTGGRLVWEISLPETIHHCEQAKLIVMMCEWDVCAGKMNIDYSGENVRLELLGKKQPVVFGDLESSIEIDGNDQRPIGPWVSTCEFTDDDVHFVELEQSWTGGVILQRQFMTIRDDRAVMVADSVVPRDESPTTGNRVIRHASRFPVAYQTNVDFEQETRELFLGHKRNESLVIPLAANEWRVGMTDATLRLTDDHHLLLSANGKDRLCNPLWFDFQKSRFKRNRTWRQLTVADELRVVGREEAVGFRIQLGSEQWLLYRSLQGSRCRSVMSKHLIADFFAGRFYMNDGSVEEIVSVDDDDENQ